MADCIEQEKKIFVSVMNIEHNMNLRYMLQTYLKCDFDIIEKSKIRYCLFGDTSNSLYMTNALLFVGNFSVCQEIRFLPMSDLKIT
jgi:hypothetical protein